MNTSVKHNYPCSKQDLYAVAKIGWQSFQAHSAPFLNLRAYYTATYATDALAEIAAAKAMPDLQARTTDAEVARIHLVINGEDCCSLWQRLKLYIEKAFIPQEHNARFDEAGQKKYSAASAKSWVALESLMDSGKNFIDLHQTELLSALNMPASFPAEFDAAKLAFDTLYASFVAFEEEAVKNTSLKIKANNLLYKKLIDMFVDGQYIFKKEPGILYRFIFDRVLNLISNPGDNALAGVSGSITDEITGSTLKDVLLSIDGHASVLTDAEGLYTFKGLGQGTYALKAEKTGYQTQKDNFILKIGEQLLFDLHLVPIPTV